MTKSTIPEKITKEDVDKLIEELDILLITKREERD